MTSLSTQEFARIKADIESTMGSTTAIGFNATVSSVTTGNDPDARTVVVQTLKCQDIMTMDGQAKERAGMANVVKAYRVKAQYNASVQARHRLIVGSDDYRIHDVVPVPVNDPLYMMLYVEDESR